MIRVLPLGFERLRRDSGVHASIELESNIMIGFKMQSIISPFASKASQTFLLVFMAAAMALAIQPTNAQNKTVQNGSVRSTHGPWSVLCDTPPGAQLEQCVMMQNVVADDRPDIGLSVIVLKTADNKARMLRVLTPLGILLPNGLGLYIDEANKGRAYFVRCFQDGCYAEVILEESLFEDLKKGNNAVFIVFQTPEEGIGIPVDLSGFTDAFNALP